MKLLATWSLILSLAFPHSIFAANPPIPQPSPTHAEGKRQEADPSKTGETAKASPKPLDPVLAEIKNQPICSEVDNSAASDRLRSLRKYGSDTKTIEITKFNPKTETDRPTGQFITMEDKSRKIKTLHEHFESLASELLAAALKCRAARGEGAKPSFLELELIKYLSETLPNELAGLTLIDMNANPPTKQSSVLSTKDFRENVLFIRQLAKSYNQILSTGFKDPDFALAFAEQLEEFARARKERKDPKVTEKLKTFTKSLADIMKNIKDPAELDGKLSPGQAVLASLLLAPNPYNDNPDRQDPPLFDAVLGNFLGASYRQLLLMGEPKGGEPGAREFSWAGSNIPDSVIREHFGSLTGQNPYHELRNSIRSSRGNSPDNELAPFWGSEKQKLANDLWQLPWEHRESVRQWVRQQLADLEKGTVKNDDPLRFEALVQMSRILDSRGDENLDRGPDPQKDNKRISPKRPALGMYYAGIMREARTSQDPSSAALFPDFAKARQAYEKLRKANLSSNARWKFMTLPEAERRALADWASQATEKDKALLVKLLENPNRTEIVLASKENPELASALYASVEEQLKDKMSGSDKARLSRVITNLKAYGTDNSRHFILNDESLKKDGEVLRESLRNLVQKLSEEAKKNPNAHAGADAASLLYNRLSEMRLTKDEIRHLDIAGTDDNGDPILEDHYGHEATAAIIKETGKDLYTNDDLNKFIDEMYSKGEMIPDKTRAILLELMKKEHDIHRTMLRRIKNIIEHRESLINDPKKGKPAELWKSLLARPTPELIEEVLKKLNGDAFKMYANVQYYQDLKQKLATQIKSDPARFAATKIGAEDYIKLAKFSLAQEAANKGLHMEKIIDDNTVTQMAKQDFFQAGLLAEALANKKEDLDEKEKQLVRLLEFGMKASGLGEPSGSDEKKKAEDIKKKLSEYLTKNAEGPLTEKIARMSMILNGDLGGMMNAHYSDLSRDAAKEIASKDKSASANEKILSILRSDFRATLSPMDKKTEALMLRDIQGSAQIGEQLNGIVKAFENEGLLPDQYKNRSANRSTLSKGMLGFYEQADVLNRIEKAAQENRMVVETSKLYDLKYEHRRNPNWDEEKRSKQRIEEKEHGKNYANSDTRADYWLRSITNKEDFVKSIAKQVENAEKAIEDVSKLNKADNQRVSALQAPINLAYEYLTTKDEKEKEKILGQFTPPAPKKGQKPIPFQEERDLIVKVLKDAKGKKNEEVMAQIAKELANRHFEILKRGTLEEPKPATKAEAVTQPPPPPGSVTFTAPPASGKHEKNLTKAVRDQIEKGYMDYISSIFKNNKEEEDEESKRAEKIGKAIDEKYGKFLADIKDEKAREAMRKSLTKELITHLNDKGLVNEQVRTVARGMQTTLDVSTGLPDDSNSNREKDYNQRVEALMLRAIASASPGEKITVAEAKKILDKEFAIASKEREKKDAVFVKAKKKWESIGGEFDGLDAVLSENTDLSLLNTPLAHISNDPGIAPSRAMIMTGANQSTIMKKFQDAGWDIKAENGFKIGNDQAEHTLQDMAKAGAGLSVKLGNQNFHTDNPLGVIKHLGRKLAIDNAAETGGFLIPFNQKTAMNVKINKDTGEVEVSQASLPQLEAGLKACMDKVNANHDQLYNATNYARTWTHTWSQLSENIFWRQSLFGADRWTYDGFDGENKAFNAYMASIQECRQYGAVTSGGKSGKDFVQSETAYRAQAALNRSKEALSEFSHKVDVVEDGGYMIIGTVATFGVGGLLSAGAAGTRAALAANAAARFNNLNRLEKLAYGLTRGISSVKGGAQVAKGALIGYQKALPIAQQAIWGNKGLLGGGILKEAGFGAALHLVSDPIAYGAMNYQLSQDYEKANELYRQGKFNLEGFGGDAEAWTKFKQKVDQNDNGIPDNNSADSLGAQWVYPDAAAADGWIGSMVNFGSMGGLGPVSQALKIPHYFHLPLFGGGAIDGLRAVAHGRKNMNQYWNDRYDSLIHLAPGLIAMELPFMSKLITRGGNLVGKAGLAEKTYRRSATIGRLADTAVVLGANRVAGEWLLEKMDRIDPHKPNPDKTWLDVLSQDVPSFLQDAYFAYKMSGSAEQRYIKGELNKLANPKTGEPTPEGIKKNAERMEQLEKKYGRHMLAAAVGDMTVPEILKAKKDNPYIYDLASELGGFKLKPEELEAALEVYQNKEKSETLKKQGLDPEKLYKEAGLLDKGTWIQRTLSNMGYGLGAVRNIADHLRPSPLMREAMPKILAEHANVVRKAYTNTGDIEYRASLANYMQKNPVLIQTFPASAFHIKIPAGAKVEDLKEKQIMDVKLLMDFARENSGIEPGRVSNHFVAGFVQYVNAQSKNILTKDKTIGEMFKDYVESFNHPAFVQQYIADFENQAQDDAVRLLAEAEQNKKVVEGTSQSFKVRAEVEGRIKNVLSDVAILTEAIKKEKNPDKKLALQIELKGRQTYLEPYAKNVTPVLKDGKVSWVKSDTLSGDDVVIGAKDQLKALLDSAQAKRLLEDPNLKLAVEAGQRALNIANLPPYKRDTSGDAKPATPPVTAPAQPTTPPAGNNPPAATNRLPPPTEAGVVPPAKPVTYSKAAGDYVNMHFTLPVEMATKDGKTNLNEPVLSKTIEEKATPIAKELAEARKELSREDLSKERREQLVKVAKSHIEILKALKDKTGLTSSTKDGVVTWKIKEKEEGK